MIYRPAPSASIADRIGALKEALDIPRGDLLVMAVLALAVCALPHHLTWPGLALHMDQPRGDYLGGAGSGSRRPRTNGDEIANGLEGDQSCCCHRLGQFASSDVPNPLHPRHTAQGKTCNHDIERPRRQHWQFNVMRHAFQATHLSRNTAPVSI